MAIPLSYNLRNLAVRRTTTLMTALGIALTVAVLLSVMALMAGLRQAFATAGNPNHVLAMRKGATAELSSAVTRNQFQELKFRPGLATNAAGETMASLELVTVINLQSEENPNGMNVTLRGLLPIGAEMRGLKLQSGRWFAAGQREVTIGKGIAKRYKGVAEGQQLKFGKGSWTIVGVFDAGDSANNSEIFGDLNQVASDYNRMEGLSSILLRVTDRAAAKALVNNINDDVKLNMEARHEDEYMESQTQSGMPIEFLGIFVSIIMAVGSAFAAMNTMYAAVSRRGKEIGTLRVLGFSKGSILVSFFLESVFLSLLGGILGVLLVLPLNGVTAGIGNFVTFSEISFNLRVTPQVMGAGIAFALVLGAIGGLFPAFSAARKQILGALREV
jgi:putative ABC transport system permease protein